MRKLLTPLLAAVLVACLTAYAVWTGERPRAHYLSDLRASVASDHGRATESGNLLVIRPSLYPSDYRDPAFLRLKLAASLDAARTAGLLNKNTVVALPDQIGTWLLLRGEKQSLYQARSLDEADTLLKLSHPTLIGRLFLQGQGVEEALLRTKAKRMARDYQKLFSGLAREYGVTLLAGSIVLPTPYFKEGKLRSGHGELYNLALAFSPDGKVLGKPYRQPWPESSQEVTLQHLDTGVLQITIKRSWAQGFPQNDVTVANSNGSASLPTFLRGRLWSLQGAPSGSALTPPDIAQANNAPGAHLLNVWLDAP
ncbi:carbon-nitrogen hydrolase family protein [Metapseudomonas boanensis]|uniref:Hydrolase n=1 Tax=Metapseudomonas boanensis TaxID=2822138 RepID=A0ABS5XAU5_9GAMM|nr:hydrolase [Pseudomonas boanensis]MBT8764752.1 hydrolase [Pseudomonas boanensis]